jgi:hypothetical protein
MLTLLLLHHIPLISSRLRLSSVTLSLCSSHSTLCNNNEKVVSLCCAVRCLLCTKRRRSFCSCYSWGPPTPAGKLWLIASFQLTHTSYCEDVGYVFWVSQNLTLILRGLLQPFVKIPNFQTSTYTSTYAHVEND